MYARPQDRFKGPGPGRPRVAVREIPCSECGTPFGQTASEMRKSETRCPACDKAYRLSRKRATSSKHPSRGTLEIVLPGRRNGFLDPKKGEWYMRVRVRKRNSDEPLKKDRIYLGLTADATPEQVAAAVTSTCARLEMSIGASSRTREQRIKARKRKHSIVGNILKWDRGRDKNHGIQKRTVSRVVYKVVLPDPLVDGRTRRFGSYPTWSEARAVRTARYKELEQEIVPCAVCGIRPVFKKAMLTHFTGGCANRVQFPSAMRKLYQTKLWNLVFSEGKYPNAEKMLPDDLHAMGYMKKGPSGRCYGRSDVEFDLSLAKNYAVSEEEIGFE